jgi:rRNA maturation protein Nop10
VGAAFFLSPFHVILKINLFKEVYTMAECGSACGGGGGGPFSEGRELVEFVLGAHGGVVARAPIPGGGLKAKCQGCAAPFLLKTFVGKCPKCGGIHAVSPPRCDNPENIQFAGKDFSYPINW